MYVSYNLKYRHSCWRRYIPALRRAVGYERRRISRIFGRNNSGIVTFFDKRGVSVMLLWTIDVGKSDKLYDR